MRPETLDDAIGAVFRRSYQAVVDQAPVPLEAPPTVDLVPSPASAPARAFRAGAIVAAGILLVAMGLVTLRPGGPLFAPSTVEYLRLHWLQEVDLRCLGMDRHDNGGFDEATIAIWGPTPDRRWRFEVAFPDGSGFVNIMEGEDPSLPWRIWSDTEPFPSPFRETGCSVMVDGEGYEWVLGDSPLVFGGFQDTGFFALNQEQLDPGSALPEPGRWRGVEVVIYRTQASGEDENGRYTALFERWVDGARQRLEREIKEMEWETLGRSHEVIEVMERGAVPVDQVSFSPGAMRLVMERPPVEEVNEAEEEIVTTTSIPPLSHPLAVGAVRVNYDQLPNDELRQLVAPTDLLWSIPVGDRSLFLAGRPGRPPLLFGTACSILASVDLPEDWEGLCLEMTIEGRRIIGVFTYEEAVAAN